MICTVDTNTARALSLNKLPAIFSARAQSNSTAKDVFSGLVSSLQRFVHSTKYFVFHLLPHKPCRNHEMRSKREYILTAPMVKVARAKEILRVYLYVQWDNPEQAEVVIPVMHERLEQVPCDSPTTLTKWRHIPPVSHWHFSCNYVYVHRIG